jgi:hypothetical protein
MKVDPREHWTLVMRYTEVHTGLQRQLIELEKSHAKGSEEYRCRAHALREQAEDTKQLISQTYKPDGSLSESGMRFLGVTSEAA